MSKISNRVLQGLYETWRQEDKILLVARKKYEQARYRDGNIYGRFLTNQEIEIIHEAKKAMDAQALIVRDAHDNYYKLRQKTLHDLLTNEE